MHIILKISKLGTVKSRCEETIHVKWRSNISQSHDIISTMTYLKVPLSNFPTLN